MGFDAAGLVELMRQRGAFNQIARNTALQFGLDNEPLLGATLLPENTDIPSNSYTEEGIRFRSFLANDTGRYTPVQLKSGLVVGSFDVKLSDSDIGSEFTGSDYDAWIRMISRSTGTPENLDNLSMNAMADLTNFVERTTALPMVKLNEKQRWDAFVNAQIVRNGDNNYRETVNIPNPAGQRVNAAGDWGSDSYDPMLDIMSVVDRAAALGYTINRVVAGRPVISALCKNKNIRSRAGLVSIIGGTSVGLADRVTKSKLNDILGDDQIPAIEEYNAAYQTQTGNGWYLDRAAMCFFCTTGRDYSISLPDAEPVVLQNVLGYHAVGRAAGQSDNGRVIHAAAFNNKPPRIESEGWQTSFPVIQDPQAVFVIKNITVNGTVLS